MIVCDIIRPILELMVVIPGMILAYLPVKSYMKQPVGRIVSWMLPLLLGACVICGGISYRLNDSVGILLLLVAASAMVIYHRTLKISLWKSVSIFLAVSAVFACVNSISRAVNAKLTADLNITQNEPWFCLKAEIFYNAMCWLFVLLAWYPASHAARTMIADDNFAQTWYIFWIVPSIFIVLNIFMVPTYRSTLYTGRILAGYVVISLVLLAILVLFYAMFLAMANGLNRNARLQQENHFLSLQKERYANLQTAIEETRQARHDMRHHLAAIQTFISQQEPERALDYIQEINKQYDDTVIHSFCRNELLNSVLSIYQTRFAENQIVFDVQIQTSQTLCCSEMTFCAILSNLLENAMHAVTKLPEEKRIVHLSIFEKGNHLLILQKNPASETPVFSNGIPVTTAKNHGIGVQSVIYYVEKEHGQYQFYMEGEDFVVRIIL